MMAFGCTFASTIVEMLFVFGEVVAICLNGTTQLLRRSSGEASTYMSCGRLFVRYLRALVEF